MWKRRLYETDDNACITRHKLDAVASALHRIEGLTGMSVLERSGSGITWARTKVTEQIDLDSGLKLEGHLPGQSG
jgi:hypothetical protein